MWKAIINLINKWGCNHQWEEKFRTNVSNDLGENYTVVTYCCTKCGKFIKRKSS